MQPWVRIPRPENLCKCRNTKLFLQNNFTRTFFTFSEFRFCTFYHIFHLLFTVNEVWIKLLSSQDTADIEARKLAINAIIVETLSLQIRSLERDPGPTFVVGHNEDLSRFCERDVCHPWTLFWDGPPLWALFCLTLAAILRRTILEFCCRISTSTIHCHLNWLVYKSRLCLMIQQK